MTALLPENVLKHFLKSVSTALFTTVIVKFMIRYSEIFYLWRHGVAIDKNTGLSLEWVCIS